MKNIGDCSSFTEQITVKVFNYNDLCRFNVTNRSLRPTTVTDSNLDMGFYRDIVASDNCLRAAYSVTLLQSQTTSQFQ